MAVVWGLAGGLDVRSCIRSVVNVPSRGVAIGLMGPEIEPLKEDCRV